MSEEQLIATPGVFGENGNFLLERELGRGGMGGVYMGRDKMLDRPVAVKVMLKEYGSDQEFVGKFKREAQAAARLIHPNIAQIYSYGFSDGMPYIAMELVAGGSLDALMKHYGAEIDVPRVMKICEQVAQALRCAADQGLVHGDVKPENILLDANGNAKLVDFGLAAMQKDTDEIWGTPYYIAPEKCRKQEVDYRADMYSLGGTLYHALTGVAPFEGDDANEVVRKRFMGPPRKPSEVRPGLSPQIDKLVMTMLAQEPKDRYPSFEALLEEFKKVMTTGLSSTSPIDGEAVPSGAASSGPKVVVRGGKKVMMRPRKTLKRPSLAAAGVSPAENAEAEGSQGSEGAEEAKSASGDDDDEEGGGNLGLKMLGVVVGIVAAIGIVVGGLFWYQASSKAKEEAAYRKQIAGGFEKARQSLMATKAAATGFADNMDEFAANTLKTCNENTKAVREVLASRYPEEVLAMLTPAEPAELVAARNALNTPFEDAAPAQAAPAPAEAP
ncbi:MAG: serine/threonine protein kinase, partial [Kiritimatiellae bacterium]|nr:serine/threonine protein kinase [Kiritimatiellia bacterium]